MNYTNKIAESFRNSMWTTNKAPLKIGDMVIVKDKCTPPTRWKLGKVVYGHPGKNGAVRAVTVHLGSGTEL